MSNEVLGRLFVGNLGGRPVILRFVRLCLLPMSLLTTRSRLRSGIRLRMRMRLRVRLRRARLRVRVWVWVRAGAAA